MGFFSWIVLGLAAGALAKLVMPGRQRGGCIMTTLLGIAGAVVGGAIGQRLGYGGAQTFSWVGLLWAVVGALLLLVAFGILFRRR